MTTTDRDHLTRMGDNVIRNYNSGDVDKILALERGYWCARLDCTEVIANINATHMAAHSPDLIDNLLWFSKDWIKNAEKYPEIFNGRYQEMVKLRKDALKSIKEYREKHIKTGGEK